MCCMGSVSRSVIGGEEEVRLRGEDMKEGGERRKRQCQLLGKLVT